MNISFSQEQTQMNDSIIMTVVLSNPTDQDVLLDSSWHVYLEHDIKAFVFWDTPTRIIYLVYEGNNNIALPARGKYVFDIKVGIDSKFFFYNRNKVCAIFMGGDYYKADKVSPQYKIHIYSNSCEITVGGDGSS